MSRVLLCYDPWMLARNLWFARALRDRLAERLGSCELSLVGPGDLPTLPTDLEAALVRSRDVTLRRWLARRIPVVWNSPALAALGNDKLLASQWLRRHGVAVPTAVPAWLRHRLDADTWVEKPRHGHGGQDVARRSGSDAPARPLDHWIAEPFVAHGDRVLRAYVIGTSPVVWLERQATDGLAANVTRGATTRLVDPDERALELVSAVCSLLGPGYYAVDVFGHSDTCDDWIVNEVEDLAGARSLVAHGVDIARAVAEGLAHELER